ncbi:MAG: response regulator, partial [Psychrosphaera sp.]|nr:response regulator [Psychrosphaera sp.]
ATYTTLAAGDYTFRVKGSNSDGQWNEGSALKITVLAPWWATTKAYVVYVLMIIILFVVTVYFRTRVLKQSAQKLSKAVDERTEQLQHETQKVNQLLADKDRLIANISHEFRTPLTLILGPLENELQTTNNAKSKGLLSLAKSNGQRLLAMVDQLLDIARVKDHTNQPRQLINVTETAVFIIESYRSLVEKHQINLTLDNKLTGPTYLMMLPDSLEKILSNLMTNALKYSADGQSVTVTLAVTQTNQLKLSVKDSGEGISEPDQQQIFERFTRVSNSSRYVPGAGIGLALVKELVESHQGSISVVSELTVGSEFSVILPLAARQDTDQATMNHSLVLSTVDAFSNEQLAIEDQQADVGTQADETKPVVLVIEDNQDMRRYLVSTLEAHYQCKTANDGEMGIELATEIQPDLIISDVMMPKKDGFEVTRTLKQDKATNHIPIILLTAHGDQQTRLQGWQEKADEFLEKPFDAKELIGRIDNLLSIRALLSDRYQKALSNPAVDTKKTMAAPI